MDRTKLLALIRYAETSGWSESSVDPADLSRRLEANPAGADATLDHDASLFAAAFLATPAGREYKRVAGFDEAILLARQTARFAAPPSAIVMAWPETARFFDYIPSVFDFGEAPSDYATDPFIGSLRQMLARLYFPFQLFMRIHEGIIGLASGPLADHKITSGLEDVAQSQLKLLWAIKHFLRNAVLEEIGERYDALGEFDKAAMFFAHAEADPIDLYHSKGASGFGKKERAARNKMRFPVTERESPQINPFQAFQELISELERHRQELISRDPELVSLLIDYSPVILKESETVAANDPQSFMRALGYLYYFLGQIYFRIVRDRPAPPYQYGTPIPSPALAVDAQSMSYELYDKGMRHRNQGEHAAASQCFFDSAWLESLLPAAKTFFSKSLWKHHQSLLELKDTGRAQTVLEQVADRAEVGALRKRDGEYTHIALSLSAQHRVTIGDKFNEEGKPKKAKAAYQVAILQGEGFWHTFMKEGSNFLLKEGDAWRSLDLHERAAASYSLAAWSLEEKHRSGDWYLIKAAEARLMESEALEKAGLYSRALSARLRSAQLFLTDGSLMKARGHNEGFDLMPVGEPDRPVARKEFYQRAADAFIRAFNLLGSHPELETLPVRQNPVFEMVCCFLRKREDGEDRTDRLASYLEENYFFKGFKAGPYRFADDEMTTLNLLARYISEADTIGELYSVLKACPLRGKAYPNDLARMVLDLESNRLDRPAPDSIPNVFGLRHRIKYILKRRRTVSHDSLLPADGHLTPAAKRKIIVSYRKRALEELEVAAASGLSTKDIATEIDRDTQSSNGRFAMLRTILHAIKILEDEGLWTDLFDPTFWLLDGWYPSEGLLPAENTHVLIHGQQGSISVSALRAALWIANNVIEQYMRMATDRWPYEAGRRFPVDALQEMAGEIWRDRGDQGGIWFAESSTSLPYPYRLEAGIPERATYSFDTSAWVLPGPVPPAWILAEGYNVVATNHLMSSEPPKKPGPPRHRPEGIPGARTWTDALAMRRGLASPVRLVSSALPMVHGAVTLVGGNPEDDTTDNTSPANHKKPRAGGARHTFPSAIFRSPVTNPAASPFRLPVGR